ncbi:MAG: hypothetical protein IPH03_11935 [Tetrasphaera sp.]|nr:hypothetical protein [Tetrasphaera sp.]
MPTEFDPRAFVRVDIGYDEHPKVAPLTDAAFRAHVEAMTWCGRNTRQNGRITKRVAAKKWRAKVVAELVAAGLLEDEEDHWSLHVRRAATPADTDAQRKRREMWRRADARRRNYSESWTPDEGGE